MSYRFDPRRGLVIVQARLTGPSGAAFLRLALDTGATGTLVNVGMLVALGYDPSLSIERKQVTTGSGVEYVPLVVVRQVAAVGITRSRLKVLAHTLPPSAGVDGLLGLDFLRNRKLAIDFRLGSIRVS